MCTVHIGPTQKIKLMGIQNSRLKSTFQSSNYRSFIYVLNKSFFLVWNIKSFTCLHDVPMWWASGQRCHEYLLTQMFVAICNQHHFWNFLCACSKILRWEQLESGAIKYSDPRRKGQCHKPLITQSVRLFPILHQELRSLDFCLKILYHLISEQWIWSEANPQVKAKVLGAKFGLIVTVY